MRKLRGVAALVALAALGLIGWRIYVKLGATAPVARKAQTAAVAVEVAPVEQGAVIHDVAQFTGTLVARSYVVIAPKIAGRLEKLSVDIGDRVQRGQVIAELDKDEIAEQVRQASAELDVASANVKDAAASLTIAQSARAIENLSQLVELDVRLAWIEVLRAREQVTATAATRRYQQEVLRAEEAKFEADKSTSFLVAQAQRDLVAAQVQEVVAVVAGLKSLIDPHRLEGSLLERRHIAAPGDQPFSSVGLSPTYEPR